MRHQAVNLGSRWSKDLKASLHKSTSQHTNYPSPTDVQLQGHLQTRDTTKMVTTYSNLCVLSVSLSIVYPSVSVSGSHSLSLYISLPSSCLYVYIYTYIYIWSTTIPLSILSLSLLCVLHMSPSISDTSHIYLSAHCFLTLVCTSGQYGQASLEWQMPHARTCHNAIYVLL